MSSVVDAASGSSLNPCRLTMTTKEILKKVNSALKSLCLPRDRLQGRQQEAMSGETEKEDYYVD